MPKSYLTESASLASLASVVRTVPVTTSLASGASGKSMDLLVQKSLRPISDAHQAENVKEMEASEINSRRQELRKVKKGQPRVRHWSKKSSKKVTEPKRGAHKPHRITSRAAFIYSIAFLVVAAGIGVSVQGWLLNRQVSHQVQVLSATSDQQTAQTDSTGSQEPSLAVPSEEKPKPNHLALYKVAADLPRLITIPSIGVRARILQVGVDGNNQIQTPRSIYDTAWYTGSNKPGEPGAALINGHFVGPTTHGVFSKIAKLKVGDAILIERGDGRQLTFRVKSIETVPLSSVDMFKVLSTNNTTKTRLNLMTCAGQYDPRTFEFADRTIVYSELE